MQDHGAAARTVLALPGSAQSVAEARAFTCRTLNDLGLSGLADTAALLVSELATNAVLHARTSYDVVVEVLGDVVRVTVLDDSPSGPHRRHHGLHAATGRGIGLVETIASDWGTGPDDAGARTKRVWFDLSTDPAGLPDLAEGGLYGEDWLAQLEEL